MCEFAFFLAAVTLPPKNDMSFRNARSLIRLFACFLTAVTDCHNQFLLNPIYILLVERSEVFNKNLSKSLLLPLEYTMEHVKINVALIQMLAKRKKNFFFAHRMISHIFARIYVHAYYVYSSHCVYG